MTDPANTEVNFDREGILQCLLQYYTIEFEDRFSWTLTVCFSARIRGHANPY